MERNYSNREIDFHFKTVNDKLDEIIVQTKKTNGRVTRLEAWRSYTAGAVAILVIVVIPLLGWVLKTIIELLQK